MRKLLLALVLVTVAASFADAGQVIKRRPVAEAGGGAPEYVAASAKSGYISGDTPLQITGMNYDVGDLCIVFIGASDVFTTPTSVTDGTNSFTALGAPLNPLSLGIYGQFWWSKIASAGSNATISLTGATNMYGVATAFVFSGSFPTSVGDIFVGYTAETNQTAVGTISSGTLGNVNEILITAVVPYSGQETVTPDGDWDGEIIDTGTTHTHAVEIQYEIVTSTDSVSNDGSVLSASNYSSAFMGGFIYE